MQQTQDGSERTLGLDAATALVVGEVIGVGIFLTPAEMIRTLGSPFRVLVVWLGVGATVLCGSLCYGALAARYPEAGGGYVYLREAWGPGVAFLYGWKSLLVMDPGLTAALAAGIGRYAAALAPLDEVRQKGVAIAAILIHAATNAVGVRIGGTVVRLLAAAKLLLLAVIVVWGLGSSHGAWSNFAPLIAPRPGSAPLLAGLAGGILAAFFSFGGFWDVAKLGGEIRDPSRNLPRALVYGVGVATVVYVLTSAAFIRLVPIDDAASGTAFAAQAGTALFGSSGGRVFAAIVLLAIASSLAAVLMAAPRVAVAMTRDGLFPLPVTPVRAIALQALLACLAVGLATFEAILAYFIFVTVAFVALTVAGLYRLPLRVPGHPVTPLGFLALLATILVLLAAGRPFEAALGTAVVALGIPVYRALVSPRLSRSPRPLEECS
jgi:APA family basic amino acid/polyamine antiporter